MSGIEVAGLVLGAFPIILSCLDYYREGFEPLEEWWNFRTHFIAFIDDIRHQMMIYHLSITLLLDPIITDPCSLNALIEDATDPRWSNGSLSEILKQRLVATELERFLRIVQRMEKEIRGLKNLLGIKDGNVRIQQDSLLPPDHSVLSSLSLKAHWAQPEQQQSWEWQMQRLRISFDMGKTKKVKKLATSNQELKEIIEYSAQIIPIAEKRKSSPPVAFFEKMFHHACAMHNALVRNWKCSSRTCRTHQANLCLRAETDTIGFNVLFVLENEQGPPLEPKKQEVMIKPAKEDAVLLSPNQQISNVQKAESFTALQASFEDTNLGRKRLSFTKFFSKTFSSTQPVLPHETRIVSAKSGKQAHFAVPALTISPDQAEIPEVTPSASSNSPPRSIADLCSSLQNCPNSNLGIIVDESDRQFQLLRSVKSSPATVTLTPLPTILDAYYQASIDIARHRRFEMAVHIASALLQIHTSPWLSSKWSKDQFYFLADAQHVYSDYPYVSQMFMPSVTEQPTTENPQGTPPSISEEETRASLFTVGVIILELIFGHNIEACSFRRHYYGSDNQPNDQTDVSTARKWSQKVLGECGIEIADVVRRCLDCSFGPRPNLRDSRFKQAVYDGVIRPLADHLKAWQITVP